MTQADTIAAIATPPGAAGLGLIRVSGPASAEVGRRLFRPAHKTCPWQSHRLYHGDLVTANGKTVLDEVLVALMRRPHSFTGEDVLEISCHGNPLILEAVLEQCLRAGCRPARPGEFSLRAFQNGRLDLAQAEALAAMISARSERAWQIGLAQLKGALGDKLRDVRSLLIDALASLEAAIDFSDDIGEEEAPPAPPQIAKAAKQIESLLATYRQGRLTTEGIRAVITGKPNVGKSSLLNSLAGRKKAIVTDIPGTTRDLITDTLTWNGLLVHLTDTAGIRAPRDIIEKEGIDRVWALLEEADVTIILLDGSRPLTDEDRLIMEQNQSRANKTLLVMNKSDLPAAWSPGDLQDRIPPGSRMLRISAKFGVGLDDLRRAVLEQAGGRGTDDGDGIIVSLRHKLALKKALDGLTAALENFRAGRSPEFAAFELHEALDAVDEITGRKIQDDVLAKIFSTFCIGK
ncbi:MAG: tRNA uridine-5-carboxymethylaminomethyl(34) synthesis GTPase MnmE [Syntrophaceae bacterium]|nr:tRNA uridine-5-carboxymethylaminomethyl(34) synthesis GTPase MnmE [Syntrophaceae bacterium]